MSFYLFLVYLALNFVRPIELLAPELGDYRPMLWLWLFAFLAACVEAFGRQRIAGAALHFKLLGAFVLALAVSQLVQGWMGGAIGAVAAFSTSSMFFLLAAMNLTDGRRLVMACGVLAASIVLMAVFSTYSYHTGWKVADLVLAQNSGNEDAEVEAVQPDNVVPAEDDSGRYLWRAHGLGFLADPNDFAQAMVMTLPLLLLAYAPGRHVRNLLFVAVPAGVLLYAIFLTHSRGAVLGLGAMLFFGVRRQLGTVRTAILGGLIAVGALATSFGGGRQFSTQESSAGDRIEAWNAGVAMFRSSPLFGVGYGSFTDRHQLTAHNSFVLCFSELGLFGYFFWLAMIVIAFQGLRRVSLSDLPDPGQKRIAELLASALVGFMVCAWFLSRTYQPTLYLLLALCVAAWYCALGASVPDVPAALRFALKPTAPAAPAGAVPSEWPWARYTWMAIVGSMLFVYLFILAERFGQ